MMSGLAGSNVSACSKCRAAAAKSWSKYIATEPRWACAGAYFGSSASALFAASRALRAVSSGGAAVHRLIDVSSAKTSPGDGIRGIDRKCLL